MHRLLCMSIVGSRFDRLVVLGLVPGNKANVRCDCGVEKQVHISNLLGGRTKSCGCLRGTPPPDPGTRFERLTVLSNWRDFGCKFTHVLCDCGTALVVSTSKLKCGHTRSCGCLMRDITIARNTTHGLRHSPEYRVWDAMKGRCFNPNDRFYPHYGGRGITVCPAWKDDFHAFYTAVGPRPGKGYSLDRIDNSKGYEPGNVRWATGTQQARNTRKNVWLEYEGQRKTLIEWAETTGISYAVLQSRRKKGWSVAEILTTPVGERRKVAA